VCEFDPAQSQSVTELQTVDSELDMVATNRGVQPNKGRERGSLGRSFDGHLTAHDGLDGQPENPE
jgi:hypothetical protein